MRSADEQSAAALKNSAESGNSSAKRKSVQSRVRSVLTFISCHLLIDCSLPVDYQM